MPRIWVAEPSEAAEITRLLIGFRDHLGRPEPDDAAFARNVAVLLAEENTEFVLGSTSEEPQGVAVLRFRHGIWRDGQDCLIEDVFVDETARGGGLGRALVSGAIDIARKRGARRALLDVNEANDPALALYWSLGFSEAYEPGDPRDLYMRLHLD